MAMQQIPELERAMQMGAERGASDVFLIPGEPLAFRVGSQVQRTEGPPLTAEEVRAIAVAAVGEAQLEKVRGETGRAITSCEVPAVVSGRMCVSSARGEYTIVVRLMPTKLGDPKYIRLPEAVLKAAESPSGLMIFSGPTGSGKTTSMLSVLDYWNSNFAGHVCTIEDPIGVVLAPKRSIVQQREVGIDVPDVLAGIAAAMRQDPDVIMIGGLKSVEEVQAAFAAAETGHLVLTQIHAELPVLALQRLLESQPQEGIQFFCQRLGRLLRCVTCQILLPHASGKGRVAAYGVLIPDREIRNQIMQAQRIERKDGQWPEGCLTFRQDIENLRREGLITEQVAREAIAALPDL